MKINFAEALFVNSPVRRFFQRKYEIPMLMKIGGEPKKGPVAEIGCGSGYGLKLILDIFKPQSLHGFDIDESMLNKASSYLAKDIMAHRVFLHNEDDNLSQLQKKKFSTIFFFGSLHHIPRWRDALKAAYEGLEEGGKIYLYEFYRPLTMNFLARLIADHPREAAFSHEELEREVLKHGLSIIGQKSFFGLAGMIVAEKSFYQKTNLNDANSFETVKTQTT